VGGKGQERGDPFSVRISSKVSHPDENKGGEGEKTPAEKKGKYSKKGAKVFGGCISKNWVLEGHGSGGNHKEQGSGKREITLKSS